jgi:hypothetical protein
MALIVLPQHLVSRFVHNDGLDGGGTYVKADQEFGDVIVRLRRLRDLLELQPKRSNLN